MSTYIVPCGSDIFLTTSHRRCTEVTPTSPIPLHPLIIVAQYKRLDIARILVTKCKNLNPTDEAGRTPMHICSANGAAEIVGALVMHG